MRAQRRIRNQLSRDVTLGEQFRDAQQSLDAIPTIVHRKLEVQYTEPLVLGGFSQQPDGIEVLRVIDLNAQETPLSCGGLAHFVWKPDKGGAHITSIDGMSVAANGGKKYRFTFRLSFTPAGGRNG
jgi:hypothetical protein